MKKNELQKHIFDTLPAGVERYELNGSGLIGLWFEDGSHLEVVIRGV
jgi:hypothetical protein